MVLGEIASPLEAELWGSDILAALGGAASLAAQAMVPAAERSGSPEALAILRGLRGLDIVGGDVVEVAPQYDATTNTAHAGAQMLFEILSLMVFSPSRA